MKNYICLVFVIGVVLAEPPRYRDRSAQNQEAEQPPYAPSGFRPSGQQFHLPERQSDPRTIYGTPTEDPTTTEFTTTDASTTYEPESSQLNSSKQKPNDKMEKKADQKVEPEDVEQVEPTANQQPQQQGIYYILLPNGQLQKVQYLTTGDLQKMAYTTQLRWENVQPITGPIYTFDPNTQFLQLA